MIRASCRIRRVLAAAVLALAAVPSAADEVQQDEAAALAFSQRVLGSKVPDYAFVTHAGEARRLSDYRGRPLLVTFVYTGCFQACPVGVQFLEKAAAQARKVIGADRFRVAVIGFNQPFDTPEAMRSFAARQGLAAAGWDFLSPAADSVQALTADFGFNWYATPKGFDHIAQVTLLDANGRIYRQIYGETFEPRELIEPMRQLIAGTPTPAGDWRAFVDRVRLLCTVYDRSSGRYRLDYSLILGIAIGLGILGSVIASLVHEWRRNRRPAV
jgi:protein SCO1/2